MANWKRGRTAFIGVGAITLIALGVSPASAHYVYQDGFTYESSDFNQCVYGYAESSHGESGNGYMEGEVDAFKSWNDSAGASAKYSDWFYDQKSSWWFQIAGEMRGPTICGDGYYGTLSDGDVNNGNWLAGSIWSGGHKLPASPSVSDGSTGDVGNLDNAYTNLDKTLSGTDGEIGTDSLVNPAIGDVTIAGPDGNPVVNPATGQPFLADLNAMSTPPTNLPGNVFEVATDLAGNPITVINQLPTGLNAGPRLGLAVPGGEFYIVPTHVAAEALTGAP